MHHRSIDLLKIHMGSFLDRKLKQLYEMHLHVRSECPLMFDQHQKMPTLFLKYQYF